MTLTRDLTFIRLGLRVCIIICIAMVLTHFLGVRQYWFALSAFLVSQTSIGTPIRQSLSIFIVMLLGTLVGSGLVYLHQGIITDVVIIILFTYCSHVFFKDRFSLNRPFSLSLIFFLIALITTLPLPTISAQVRFEEISIGALLGLVIGRVLLWGNLGNQFKKEIQPTLQSIDDYMAVLANYYQGKQDKMALNKQRTILEDVLISPQMKYPAWVFEAGFNPGLSASLRFFLVQIDYVIEICLASHFLALQYDDVVIPANLAMGIAGAIETDRQILKIIHDYFRIGAIQELDLDFTNDINALEATLLEYVPGSLELIDLSAHYVLLTALVKDRRDCRGILLTLLLSLEK